MLASRKILESRTLAQTLTYAVTLSRAITAAASTKQYGKITKYLSCTLKNSDSTDCLGGMICNVDVKLYSEPACTAD